MDIQGTTEQIHAYLSGQLPTDQVKAFEKWQEDSVDNAARVEQLRSVWESALLYETPTFDSVTAIEKMPFATKKATVVEIKSKTTTGHFSRWVAAAAVILAIGTWGFYQLNKPEIREINGLYAQFVNLEDGTEVFLDDSSEVAFPETFAGNERLVYLDGEAYFDVAKEAERQFVIETDFAKVVVLGTEFSVDEDDEKQSVEVFVTEGKVRLQPSGSDVFIDVEVGESALYDHRTGKLQRTKQANMNNVAWHTKQLQFVKTAIPDVIKFIESTYDVSIDYKKTGIAECTFSSLYDNAEVTKILGDMSVVFGFRITSPIEGHYVLTGGNCNPVKSY